MRTPLPSPTAASVPAFDYALIRVVPRVHTGDGESIGVILQCRQKRFIGVAWREDPHRLAARWPSLGPGLTARYLASIQHTAQGAGPIGRFPASERFHWLTAPRSTVVQCSPVHTGVTDDPQAALDSIVASLS